MNVIFEHKYISINHLLYIGVHIHPYFTEKKYVYEDDLSERKSQGGSEESEMGIDNSPNEKRKDKVEHSAPEKSDKPLDQVGSIQGADIGKSEEVFVPDPFFMFCNYAIDYGTARIMNYVWPSCNLTILKYVKKKQ